MHTHTAPRPISSNPTAERIARLSEEYLTASPARKEAIGEEIAGMIAGRVVALTKCMEVH